MQLANIASLVYRHPMSTYFLRATFDHFLNALQKSGCRFKVDNKSFEKNPIEYRFKMLCFGFRYVANSTQCMLNVITPRMLSFRETIRKVPWVKYSIHTRNVN